MFESILLNLEKMMKNLLNKVKIAPENRGAHFEIRVKLVIGYSILNSVLTFISITTSEVTFSFD